jgi:hypothetical protein
MNPDLAAQPTLLRDDGHEQEHSQDHVDTDAASLISS